MDNASCVSPFGGRRAEYSAESCGLVDCNFAGGESRRACENTAESRLRGMMDGYGGTSIFSSTEGLGQESLPECYEVIPLTRQGQSLPQRPHCAWFFAQYSRSSGDHRESSLSGFAAKLSKSRISTTIPAGKVSSQTSATPPCTETNILCSISLVTSGACSSKAMYSSKGSGA